jgi:CRP-like cAMP-binding protein
MAIEHQLRNLSLFSSVDDAGLARVAALATEFTAPAGQVLIETGHAATGVFVIEEGTVRVDLKDGSHIERGPGDSVGELAVLAEIPRTARVVTTTDVRALAIRRDDLTSLLHEEPSIAVAMLRSVARRLADVS